MEADSELLKKAAITLRNLNTENEKLKGENQKISAENTALKKHVEAFEVACKLAAEGDIDVDDISERVTDLSKEGHVSTPTEVNFTRMVRSGIGRIKTASVGVDGESDPLTSFLLGKQ